MALFRKDECNLIEEIYYFMSPEEWWKFEHIMYEESIIW